jgi:putative endonuclease
MMDEKRIGEIGEEAACQYLREAGYRIVTRNWGTRFGEIDIVARDGDVLVFVEVKTRRGQESGVAEAAVGPAKQRRLTAAAKAFLAAYRCDLASRFDVVALEGNEVQIVRNAFQVDDVRPAP